VADAPCPILTITMTAETPMMIPSIVSAARDLLRASARKAMRMIINTFMTFNLTLSTPASRPRAVDHRDTECPGVAQRVYEE
jgi:hypothetical protein